MPQARKLWRASWQLSLEADTKRNSHQIPMTPVSRCKWICCFSRRALSKIFAMGFAMQYIAPRRNLTTGINLSIEMRTGKKPQVLSGVSSNRDTSHHKNRKEKNCVLLSVGSVSTFTGLEQT